jgi:hypothetical protein
MTKARVHQSPGAFPEQVHLDIRVDDIAEVETRVLALKATRLMNEEPSFRVHSDPAGHLFCLERSPANSLSFCERSRSAGRNRHERVFGPGCRPALRLLGAGEMLLGADDKRFQAVIVVSLARRFADAEIKLGMHGTDLQP